MHKYSIEERKMRAIELIAETTISYQQIQHETALRWKTIVEIYKELKKEGFSLKHRGDDYKPRLLEPIPSKTVELNLGAWHNEVSQQSRRRGPALDVPTKSRTRSAHNLETIISRYKR